MVTLKYLSEIPFQDFICPDYQLQKKCRKSDEITTPFGLPANLTLILVSRTNVCRIIDHNPLDQRNTNSCFLHRETSVKLVSAELDFNYLSVNPSHSNQIDCRFTFYKSHNPGKPFHNQTRAYRLPSNHRGPRETNPGCEFAASKYL